MRIGKLFGIDIIVNVSWLFVFALWAWLLAGSVGPFGGIENETARVVLGVVTALLFFGCVLVHELAHSLVARSRGIAIRGITLFIFGGVSMLDGEPSNAPSEAWISAVGPLTSAVLGGLFFVLGLAAGPQSAVGIALEYLAFANCALAVLNILPVFPMDGGRVLHALLWRATGDRLRATRIAAGIGRIIAGVVVAWGIFETLRGISGGLWLTFIGWYLIQAGEAEKRQAEVSRALSGHSVSDLAAPAVLRIPADDTAEAALATLIRTRERSAPVFVGERCVGIVSLEDFAKVSREEMPRTYVTAVMTRLGDLATVGPATDAVEALRVLARSRVHELAVVGSDGEVTGFVTREAVLNWLAKSA